MIKKKYKYKLSIDGYEITNTIEINVADTQNLNEKQKEEFEDLQKEYLKQMLNKYVLSNMKLEFMD